MLEAFETDEFDKWLTGLRDIAGKARIIKQIQRIQIAGRYVGDWKPIGDVVEIRLFFGPGYRLYTSIEDGNCCSCSSGATNRPSRKT